MLRQWMIVLTLTILAGCVERTITIKTEPKGALVYLNDKEVGRTPVTVPFEWYGDYEVIVRKDGYQPLRTHRRPQQPWYEYIPVDIFSELLYPGTIHNDHFWDFDLQKAEPVNITDLQQRALEIRAQAREENPQTSQPVTTSPAATQPVQK